MPDKEYKTHRQLLAILRSRGMTIGKGAQGSRVMRILENFDEAELHGFAARPQLVPRKTETAHNDENGDETQRCGDHENNAGADRRENAPEKAFSLNSKD